MCGRLSLFVLPSVLEAQFGVEVPGSYTPRYNVAPTEDLAVIRDDAPETIDYLTWGLVPRWADDPSIGSRLINARAETLAEKPSFRDAYENRRCSRERSEGELDTPKGGRCLVLADGFYEWREDGGRKQPYRVCRPDDEPFAMAGLWERWEGNGDVRETTTIVTTEPNDVVRPLHDRMAAILPPDEERRWLDADEESERESLLAPYDGNLRAYPISTRVNDPGNDGPSIIEEVEPEGGTQSGLGDFG
jgi:putative SOS response-associated peptidase YedK